MRGASNQQVVKSGMAVRAHHDVISRESFRLLDDVRDGSAVELHRFCRNLLLNQTVLKLGQMLGCGLFSRGGDLSHVLDVRSILTGDHRRLDDRQKNNPTLYR